MSFSTVGHSYKEDGMVIMKDFVIPFKIEKISLYKKSVSGQQDQQASAWVRGMLHWDVRKNQ